MRWVSLLIFKPLTIAKFPVMKMQKKIHTPIRVAPIVEGLLLCTKKEKRHLNPSIHSTKHSKCPSLGHCLLHCNPRVIHGERLWKIPLEDHLFVGSLPWSRDVSYPRARHKLTACGGLALL